MSSELLPSSQLPYTKQQSYKLWTNVFYILGLIIIKSHIHEQPLEPLDAIEYFLHKQKRILLGTDSKERDYEAVQLLYRIAKQIFEKNIILEERTIDVLLDVCEQAQKQFYKIKEASSIENLEELKKNEQGTMLKTVIFI